MSFTYIYAASSFYIMSLTSLQVNNGNTGVVVKHVKSEQ